MDTTKKPKDPNVVAMGKRIAEARYKAGLSQKALGERLNDRATERAVQAWEQGEYRPTTLRLANLCEILEVTISWLVEGDDGDRDSERYLSYAEYRSWRKAVSAEIDALRQEVAGLRLRS